MSTSNISSKNAILVLNAALLQLFHRFGFENKFQEFDAALRRKKFIHSIFHKERRRRRGEITSIPLNRPTLIYNSR